MAKQYLYGTSSPTPYIRQMVPDGPRSVSVPSGPTNASAYYTNSGEAGNPWLMAAKTFGPVIERKMALRAQQILGDAEAEYQAGLLRLNMSPKQVSLGQDMAQPWATTQTTRQVTYNPNLPAQQMPVDDNAGVAGATTAPYAYPAGLQGADPAAVVPTNAPVPLSPQQVGPYVATGNAIQSGPAGQAYPTGPAQFTASGGGILAQQGMDAYGTSDAHWAAAEMLAKQIEAKYGLQGALKVQFRQSAVQNALAWQQRVMAHEIGEVEKAMDAQDKVALADIEAAAMSLDMASGLSQETIFKDLVDARMRQGARKGLAPETMMAQARKDLGGIMAQATQKAVLDGDLHHALAIFGGGQVTVGEDGHYVVKVGGAAGLMDPETQAKVTAMLKQEDEATWLDRVIPGMQAAIGEKNLTTRKAVDKANKFVEGFKWGSIKDKQRVQSYVRAAEAQVEHQEAKARAAAAERRARLTDDLISKIVHQVPEFNDSAVLEKTLMAMFDRKDITFQQMKQIQSLHAQMYTQDLLFQRATELYPDNTPEQNEAIVAVWQTQDDNAPAKLERRLIEICMDREPTQAEFGQFAQILGPEHTQRIINQNRQVKEAIKEHEGRLKLTADEIGDFIVREYKKYQTRDENYRLDASAYSKEIMAEFYSLARNIPRDKLDYKASQQLIVQAVATVTKRAQDADSYAKLMADTTVASIIDTGAQKLSEIAPRTSFINAGPNVLSKEAELSAKPRALLSDTMNANPYLLLTNRVKGLIRNGINTSTELDTVLNDSIAGPVLTELLNAKVSTGMDKATARREMMRDLNIAAKTVDFIVGPMNNDLSPKVVQLLYETNLAFVGPYDRMVNDVVWSALELGEDSTPDVSYLFGGQDADTLTLQLLQDVAKENPDYIRKKATELTYVPDTGPIGTVAGIPVSASSYVSAATVNTMAEALKPLLRAKVASIGQEELRNRFRKIQQDRLAREKAKRDETYIDLLSY